MWKYFRQLVSAVWYCHEVVNIFHRDIKPDNILIDMDDNIKLTDFGVSENGKTKKHKHKDEKIYGNAGSYCYFCPEACKEDGYSGKQADLWACGITLYQMVYAGKLPFTSKQNSIQDLYEKIRNDQITLEVPGLECKFNQIKDLLEKMLHKDPEKRLTIGELQRHPWITKNGAEPCSWSTDVEYVDFQKVTEDEMMTAMTSLKQYVNMKFMKK